MAYFLFGVHVLVLGVLLGNLVYLRRQARRAALAAPPRWPAVSVLIPARNEADNLRRLMPSLLSQDYPDFEVIVYDDGSEDETGPVLQSFAGEGRLRTLRGEGPPAGWVGKVHALYQATRHTDSQGPERRYLFLDADAELADARALRRLVAAHEALPEDAVMTGLTRLRGGGLLAVSLVPQAVLAGLPWPLVRLVRSPSLGALNGQCWLIRAEAYHRHEPHVHVASEVLEDVMIGRYLKGQGLTPVLVDVQREVSIFMYEDLPSAWLGFRKNAYLIAGGTPWAFAPVFVFYLLTYVLAPLFNIWLLASLYGLKALTDRKMGFPLWVTLLAPVSFVISSLIQLDSAVSHWTGRVAWKGRKV